MTNNASQRAQKALAANPGKSDRAIAAEAGVSHMTVRRLRGVTFSVTPAYHTAGGPPSQNVTSAPAALSPSVAPSVVPSAGSVTISAELFAAAIPTLDAMDDDGVREFERELMSRRGRACVSSRRLAGPNRQRGDLVLPESHSGRRSESRRPSSCGGKQSARDRRRHSSALT
jgi:hypothetical protein